MAEGQQQTASAGDIEAQHAEVRASLWRRLQRLSRQLIYAVMMHGGGEPFGAPFELGLQSLTEPVVRRFAQHGFFAFEAWESAPVRGLRNKFTRHGAAPFRGPYRRVGGAADGRRRPARLRDRILWRRRR